MFYIVLFRLYVISKSFSVDRETSNSLFRFSDYAIYLHECSPFGVGIFITFNKENCHVYCFM